MANGLFMTPEDVLMAQRAQTGSMSRQQMQNQLRGSLFNLGGGIGRGITQAFGADPRSPLEQRQAQVLDIVKQMDLADPASIRGTIEKLNQEGFTNEAMKLFGLLPKPTKTFGPLQKQRISITDDSGNITNKDIFGQFASDGSFQERYSITSSGELRDNRGADIGIDPIYLKDITLDEDIENLMMQRFKDIINSEQFGDLDLEEITGKGIEGHVVTLANEKRGQDIQKFVMAVDALQQRGVQLNKMKLQALARTVIPSQAETVRNAFNEFLTSGQFREFLEAPSVPGLDPEVRAQGQLSPTLAEAQQDTVKEQQRKAIQQAVTDRTGGQTIADVEGDPRKGQFSIFNLRSAKQKPERDAFVNSLVSVARGELAPEEALQQLSSNGFEFSEKSLDVHLPVWEMISETPTAAELLTVVDDKRAFESTALRRIEEFTDDGNFQTMYQYMRIRDYLRNMAGSPATDIKVRGRRNF